MSELKWSHASPEWEEVIVTCDNLAWLWKLRFSDHFQKKKSLNCHPLFGYTLQWVISVSGWRSPYKKFFLCTMSDSLAYLSAYDVLLQLCNSNAILNLCLSQWVHEGLAFIVISAIVSLLSNWTLFKPPPQLNWSELNWMRMETELSRMHIQYEIIQFADNVHSVYSVKGL